MIKDLNRSDFVSAEAKEVRRVLFASAENKRFKDVGIESSSGERGGVARSNSDSVHIQ
jgi:hypothetical protein